MKSLLDAVCFKGVSVRWFGCGFSQVVDFGVCEEPELAYAEAAVGDFADTIAFEGFDGQTYTREHSSYFAIQPFGNADLDERTLVSPF